MIKKLLEKWACKHRWELYHGTNVYRSSEALTPYEIRHTLICQKCGKIKTIKI